jgi:hypothetical protein
MHFWKLGDDISAASRRVLIGVAPYSGYDLKLLEALNELPLDPISDRIDVFDVLACQTQEDFEKYIPGIGKVYQTPVVGIWEQGRLLQRPALINALQNDSDIDNRAYAASCLGTLRKGTKDSEAIAALKRVLENESEDELVRKYAYRSLLEIVRDAAGADFSPHDKSLSDVDWDWVRSLSSSKAC